MSFHDRYCLRALQCPLQDLLSRIVFDLKQLLVVASTATATVEATVSSADLTITRIIIAASAVTIAIIITAVTIAAFAIVEAEPIAASLTSATAVSTIMKLFKRLLEHYWYCLSSH